MNRENRICAMCDHFHTEDRAKAAAGIGACHGFDSARPVQPFVAWDSKFCVMFRQAPDTNGHRARYVAKQMAKAAA